jgi:hypothetical protein
MCRSSVALLMVVFVLAACGGASRRSGAAPSDDELLRLRGEPSGDGEMAVVVENVSDRALVVSREVAIEAVELTGADYQGRELSDFSVEPRFFFLVESCDQETTGCVSLEPGESLRTVPWTGTYAAPQCPRETPSDYPAPTGRYRFVVTACSGGYRFYSPAFDFSGPAS